MHEIFVRPAVQLPEGLKGYPGWMGRLLFARGLETAETAEAFLHPCREQILSPFLLRDMEKAKAILEDAVARRLPIVIYGDYDCDGVCACAILMETLEKMGALVQVYIPDRHEEGYGLNTAAVEKLAKDFRVLVTVDCGITSVEEIRLAKDLGMRVILTDHHTVGDALPPADAVITPHLGDYPFPGLCGAGVAWKLALALSGAEAEGLMELAALATVADMVPLLQENRAIVKLGLEMLGKTKRPGLVTLMELAGIRGEVEAQHVAFQLAPRINACGRMGSARTALNLLTCRQPEMAMEEARQAHQWNDLRKQMENEVIDQASLQVHKTDLTEYHALVVHGEGWNSGVVGLAAGKLAETWGYPAVALAREGENYVGSARSASQVDIYQALKTCEDLFLRFGGHRQAAGMTLPASNLPAFQARLSQAVKDQLKGKAPRRQFVCDGEMALEEVTVEAVGMLRRLEPFGMGNPSPVFLCRHAMALQLRAVGAEGRHLQCQFQQGMAVRKGIFFGAGAMQGREGTYSLVFSPQLNEFRGQVTAQLQLKHLALEADALRPDSTRAAAAFAGALRGEGRAVALDASGLDALMEGEQGTLLVCRTLETALQMHRRYPGAVFALEEAMDPRVYHTIFLYASPGKACAAFRHVVLCDGELQEAAAWQAACPEAGVYALTAGDAMRRLCRQMALDKDALRICYQEIRRLPPRDLVSYCEGAGVSGAQAHFALRVLQEVALITFNSAPFEAALLPMTRRSPEESGLYRLVHQLKEEPNGVFGL